MSSGTEKAKQLFVQAKSAYVRDRDVFNNAFNIPAELLFVEICKIAKIDPETYPHFRSFH